MYPGNRAATGTQGQDSQQQQQQQQQGYQQGGYQQGSYQQGGYQQGYQQGGYQQGYGGYPPPGGYGYGYPPPGGFGYPPPGGFGGYGAPGYPPQGYGGYGYGQVMHPQSYTRMHYDYGSAYNPNQGYMVPIGVSQVIAQKMMTASNAFRYFDKDHTGTLNQNEWAQCMSYLGINIPENEMNRLYYMIDSDRSGTINEREFCEWFSSCY
ncbi:hypothetical protein BCR36DRAFT_579994 [Piromyces finnis]|uniref:EF-hand domain-containing protein n=1 Tax=Piromyces finnis TaxID=1754191 RepID=A0A1Y1VJY3_9FUNG|nr:hypothetical protein BCR36DRAFT_579994 [Piromyces finnis]|eukprot:ORX58365.1 hypothetical protein BCR36DRAFT_579994 [Piromyces finnis]